MPSTPRHSLIRPHGHFIIDDPDAPRIVEHDVLRCAHCQVIMVYRKGSGGKLGFCARCNGVVCGNAKCGENCLNWEKALDLYEQGKIDSL